MQKNKINRISNFCDLKFLSNIYFCISEDDKAVKFYYEHIRIHFSDSFPLKCTIHMYNYSGKDDAFYHFTHDRIGNLHIRNCLDDLFGIAKF